MKPTEDDPLRVPKSYHPFCVRCNHRHSAFAPCYAKEVPERSLSGAVVVSIVFFVAVIASIVALNLLTK